MNAFEMFGVSLLVAAGVVTPYLTWLGWYLRRRLVLAVAAFPATMVVSALGVNVSELVAAMLVPVTLFVWLCVAAAVPLRPLVDDEADADTPRP